LPRGGITEICGQNSSGRTSLLMSALAPRTAQFEACAFIDARDAQMLSSSRGNNKRGPKQEDLGRFGPSSQSMRDLQFFRTRDSDSLSPRPRLSPRIRRPTN
jgi:hypothetical protein